MYILLYKGSENHGKGYIDAEYNAVCIYRSQLKNLLKRLLVAASGMNVEYWNKYIIFVPIFLKNKKH